MKRLLVLFSFLSALASCVATQSFDIAPTYYHSIGNTWSYRRPGGEPIYSLPAGISAKVVGAYNDWLIVLHTRTGERHYVPGAAFVIDTDSVTEVYSNVYYYPHQAGSLYAPGVGPAYSLSTGKATYLGPRGGEYYINGNGNKTYLTPQSTIDNNLIQTGPRGGQYYINSNGRKTYIKH